MTVAADRSARSQDGGARAAWSGLLPVDKPAGPTSHDVVARMRRRLGERRIGHLGTLDPAATGLLVLAIGAATRCATVWQGGEKTYAATVRFGVVTDTQDLQGRVLSECAPAVAESELRATSAALTGEIRQRPPMVSAVHVGGRRLHEMAREGIEVERPERAVHVASWEWTRLALPGEADFVVRCSGGTYVRTLAHDLGERLGCGAALASLRRLGSAPFDVRDAAPWSEIEAREPQELLARRGIPLDRALESLPAVVLDAGAALAIGQGARPGVADVPDELLDRGERSVVLRDQAGSALALGEVRVVNGRPVACPNVVFEWAVRSGGGA